MTSGLALAAWATYEQSLVGFILGLVGQGAVHGLSQPSISTACFIGAQRIVLKHHDADET
jgi:hypothetical protein